MAFVKPIAKCCFLPFYTIVPMILVFVFIGGFAAHFNDYDLLALVVFSALGFMMRRHGWPRAPLLLGVVLGTKMELYLWLSYTRYGADWLLRPGVMVLFALLLASVFYPVWQNRQRTAAYGSAVET